MRQCNKNKQKMLYSIPLGQKIKYQRDEDGNIEYDDYTGDPIETGEYEDMYSQPKEFLGNIAGKIRENMAVEFGAIESPNYATLILAKEKLYFPTGTLIFKHSEPEYKMFDGELILDAGSADYDVVGNIDEPMFENEYLLHKRRK